MKNKIMFFAIDTDYKNIELILEKINRNDIISKLKPKR